MKEMEQLLRQANINYNSAEFLHVHLKVLGDPPPHTHIHFRVCIMIRLSL